MTEFPHDADAPAEVPALTPAPDGSPAASELAPPVTAETLGRDPIRAFLHWLSEAEEASGLRYPNAVTLATVDAQGQPDARIVLLKGADERGFLFFTNYRSTKGRELETHPEAAMVFHWDAMGRQVRVRGRTERLPLEESDAYFESRPRGSRIGAWTSEQSARIEDRDTLEARYRAVEARYVDEPVPRPEHWGGYVLRPREIEFWKEGAWRLHDRIRYRWSEAEEGWVTERLQP